MNNHVNLRTAFGMEVDRLYQANKPKNDTGEERLRRRVMGHIRSAAKQGHGGIRLDMVHEQTMTMERPKPDFPLYGRISNYLTGQGMVSVLSEDCKELVVRWTDDDEYTVMDLRPETVAPVSEDGLPTGKDSDLGSLRFRPISELRTDPKWLELSDRCITFILVRFEKPYCDVSDGSASVDYRCVELYKGTFYSEEFPYATHFIPVAELEANISNVQ